MSKTLVPWICGIALLLGSERPVAAAEPVAAWVRPEYSALRAAGPITIDGKLDEPSWMGAPAVGDFVFPWWTHGVREQTVAKLLWDDRCLYVACVAADRHITARITERDGPVQQDDCFEIMLLPDPDQPQRYFNLEWNVLGTLLDNFRPRGPQQPRAPRWDAEGVEIRGQYAGTLNDDDDEDERWIVEAAIPFANFAEFARATPPQPGSHWLMNLNRHGGQTNPQYSQWSAGDTPQPSFHTPHRFGKLHFSADTVATGAARRVPLTPLEAVARMSVPSGVRVTAFAAEPEIRQPILVKCDDRGRVWVIQYLQYPNPAGLERVQVDRWSRTQYDRVPLPPPQGPRGADRITICEDRDHDGRADTFTDFADGLNLCTGLAFGNGGVYVLQAPYLLFYPDRDRNDVPDSDPEVLLTGFGMEDAQSLASHLTWGPDGWLYGVNGSTTTCRIRGIEFQQGVWRYHPRSKQFELFCEGGGNLFGLTFDRRGQLFFTSNGGDLCLHAWQGAYYRKAFTKHGPLHNPFAYGYFADVPKEQPVIGGPCTSGTIYSADQLPAPFHESLLCGDFLGHTCSWWKLNPRGSSFRAARGGTLLDANDPWFGPTDLAIGPDGAVYISDFHDRRTAHPDPDADWDRSTGRIYRLTGRAASPVPTIDLAQRTNRELVELLGHRNGWYRERARVLLAERGDATVLQLLRAQTLDPSTDPTRVLEMLWVIHTLDGLDPDLVRTLLRHPDEAVRFWIVRLVGDNPRNAERFGSLLVSEAAGQTSLLVRSQLAATARRLPAAQAIPLLASLTAQKSVAGEDDTELRWLIWWGLESQVELDRSRLFDTFAQPAWWKHGRGNWLLSLLVRRCAAEGTADGYDACTRLLRACEMAAEDLPLTALGRGLAERTREPAGIGQGELFRDSALPVPPPALGPVPSPHSVHGSLHAWVERAWLESPRDVRRLRVAMLCGIDAASQSLLEWLRDEHLARDEQLPLLELLAELGSSECIPAVVRVLHDAGDPAVELACIRVLGRFDQPAAAAALLTHYPKVAASHRTELNRVLLSRKGTARALLERVDRGELPPSDLSLDDLRRLAPFRDESLDALVRKHWGRIRGATPEEKLAVMRRLNNDLRAAPGDPAAGKQLFRQHCANCHVLFNEGEKVGPDLTHSSRHNTEFLLASLVDPSAMVRREYTASTIVTTGGQIWTGRIVAEEAGQVTLVDPRGQRYSLPRRDIEQIEESPVSLMPEQLVQSLSPTQLRDLFAYLQTK